MSSVSDEPRRGVAVGAGEGVFTGVGEGVFTGVGEGVLVGAGERVAFGVGAGVLVGVGVGTGVCGGGGVGAGVTIGVGDGVRRGGAEGPAVTAGGAAVGAAGGGAPDVRVPSPPTSVTRSGPLVPAGTDADVVTGARAGAADGAWAGAGAADGAGLGSGVVGAPSTICGNGKPPGALEGWTYLASPWTNTRASARAAGRWARATSATSVAPISRAQPAPATARRGLPRTGMRVRSPHASVARTIAATNAAPVRIAAGDPNQSPSESANTPHATPTQATPVSSFRDIRQLWVPEAGVTR